MKLDYIPDTHLGNPVVWMLRHVDENWRDSHLSEDAGHGSS